MALTSVNGSNGAHSKAPPPPPHPDGTSASGFQQAVTTAERATDAAYTGGSEADVNTANQDWGIVLANMENQYRLAEESSDPKAAIAKLDQEYAAYFQQQGVDPDLSNALISDARTEVASETPDQFRAQLQLFAAESEPDSSPTKTQDITIAAIALAKADINAQLHLMFGNGNNGVYSADQIKQAAAALDQADPQAAPLIDYVAAGMESPRAGLLRAYFNLFMLLHGTDIDIIKLLRLIRISQFITTESVVLQTIDATNIDVPGDVTSDKRSPSDESARIAAVRGIFVAKQIPL
jgi:hypothetical protein